MEKKTIAEHQEFAEGKFTKRVIYKGENHVVFVLNFEPGTALPAHNHPGSTVTILVLEGNGKVDNSGEEVQVASGDVLQFTGDEILSYQAESRSSLYVVITQMADERFARNV